MLLMHDGLPGARRRNPHRAVLPRMACPAPSTQKIARSSRLDVTPSGRSKLYRALIGLTFFRSDDRGLYVPAKLPRERAKHEARKRRANERPRVGCCEELGRNYAGAAPWHF